MKKSGMYLLSLCVLFMIQGSLLAAVAPDPAPIIRPSVFSTSADWEAVTGLRLNEYRVYFGRDRTIGTNGAELYFLDGFPCYAQSENVRVWISPSAAFYDIDKNTYMRIVCAAVPEKINIAYRDARANAPQGKTDGIMTCKTEVDDRDITVNLSACDKLIKWDDYK